ncbi:MAG: hypothetical protein ACYTF0_05335, partial [Planctomycetota bacterium]
MDDIADSTADAADTAILAARRQILINRHRSVIEEMESTITDNVVAGDTEHPRLKAMLAKLDDPSIRERRDQLINEIDSHADVHGKHSLHQAMVDELALMRERAKDGVAGLQMVAIAAYRHIAATIKRHYGHQLDLATLRNLPAPATITCVTSGE